MPSKKTLTTTLAKLKESGVNVSVDKSSITLSIDLTQIHFSKITPLLYFLLNTFENMYLIRIKGIPFCLMPDAADHLIYEKDCYKKYIKNGECQKCKYFKMCPGWIKDGNLPEKPTTINNLPREIVFEVTNKCNLNCPICFSSKGSNELPLSRVKGLIDECRALGIKNVRFTGGEPLLYTNISDALYYAKSRHLHITVNTNATIMNESLQKTLKDCADNILVSFQGFNLSSEKRLTRSTVDLKEKIHNLTQLKSHIAIVRLGTIISRTLINNFSKYCRLIKSLGIKNWELYRPMSNMQSEEFCIGSKDFIKLMKYVKLQRLQDNDIIIANPIPFCITKDLSLSHHVLMGAEFDDGHSRLIVDVRGFLKPSYFISENLGIAIQDAWKNPFIEKLRSPDSLPSKCQSCSSLKWCKGGSRHWAKTAHGSYFEADPLMI